MPETNLKMFWMPCSGIDEIVMGTAWGPLDRDAPRAGTRIESLRSVRAKRVRYWFFGAAIIDLPAHQNPSFNHHHQEFYPWR